MLKETPIKQMSDQDIYVRRILEAVNKILRYSKSIENYEAFKNNQMVYDAIIVNLVIIAEAEEKLSDDYKNQNNHVGWQQIRYYRKSLSNIYFGLDKKGVWNVVTEKLPNLKRELEAVLI